MTEKKLPAPLVPPEVDLRDFGYMPLEGDRLFKSDTWIMCDDAEKVAALRLWWAAWHQEPAGSLPDNDRLLADLAGYGVAVAAFQAVKVNAMRGWLKCSDGRLYHPVVCKIALDSWKGKKRKESENAAERERKRRKRAGVPADNDEVSARTTQDIPADKAAVSGRKGAERPAENGAASARTTPQRPADKLRTGTRPGDTVDARPADNGAVSGGNETAKPASGGNAADVRRTDAEIPAENALKGNMKKKGREEEPTPPPSSVAPRAEPDPAGALVQDFLALRLKHWENTSRMHGPLVTIRHEIDQHIAQGATPDLLREVLDREMGKAVAKGDDPPSTLAAYGLSIARAVKQFVKPVPAADGMPEIPANLRRPQPGDTAPEWNGTYQGRATSLGEHHPAIVEHRHLTTWTTKYRVWSQTWDDVWQGGREPKSSEEAQARLAALEPVIWPDATRPATETPPATRG